MTPADEPVLQSIVRFLNGIGLPVVYEDLPEDTWFPGILVRRGEIVVDRARLKHPGDILHEAGHIAMIPAELRATANGDLDFGGGVELAATAWSYAALVELGLPAAVVFHPESYGGEGDHYRQVFEDGRYFGMPLMERAGMTCDTAGALRLGVAPYPAMQRWLL